MNDSQIQNISELIVNNLTSSNSSQPPHKILEGGFLSGRNVFVFNAHFPLPTFIIQLLIIVCMSRIVKLILSPIRQPAVIAEIISGIILGPSVLGHIPSFSSTIFPKESLPFLNLMSNFGLVLFLFLVGLELDPRMLKQSVKNSLVISLAGMTLPFAAGVGVSYILYSYVEPPSHQTGFTKYFLFLGVAMAITAFPVLARILTELNLLKTKVGGITISAAAIDDATSWCLLALVISLINAGSGLIALYVFLIGLGYSLFLIFGVRPVYVYILRRSGAFETQPSPFVMFLTLCLLFISALITDAIGIHAIFGGFLAGIIVPHESGFAYHITEKLEDIVAILFLPLYFALSGLRTSISSLDDPLSWAIVVLVIFVACFGKIFGCTLAARATNMSWRESITVGCLMNCKGLVELIVLNLGYDAQVISERTFAIMVIMALVTTFITVPLVSFTYPPQYHVKYDECHSLQQRSKKPSFLVCVNKVEQVPAILSLIHLLQSKLLPSPSAPVSRKGSGQSISSIPGALSPTKGSFGDFSKVTWRLRSTHHATPLAINALRLIELTERDSSVMLQTSQDALKNDPVMKMVRTFGEMASIKVRSLVKVVTMKNFGDTLAFTAQEVNARFILVPWSGSGSLLEENLLSPIQQVFTQQLRRQSIHTSVQHANFIQDLFSSAPCSVLILVDRGIDSITSASTTPNPINPDHQNLFSFMAPSTGIAGTLSFQHIYFPFFGGQDDRAALEMVLELSGVDSVRITIVRYKNTVPRRFSADSAESSEDTISPAELVGMDAKDEECIANIIGADGKRNPVHQSIAYSEVDSYTPISAAIQSVNSQGSRDLIIIGRGSTGTSRVPSTSQFLKNADNERRKVLGDVAEAVLLCNVHSSVLVVQAQKVVPKLP